MGVIEKARMYLREVVVETRKVTWPQREDLKESTLVVIASVTALAFILGIVDRILSIAIEHILRIS
jgi:preprotein translocase subunit SecE